MPVIIYKIDTSKERNSGGQEEVREVGKVMRAQEELFFARMFEVWPVVNFDYR